MSDASNGYQAVAAEFMQRRATSSIGVATVQTWATSALPPGAAILDLGCGCGAPIAAMLSNEGFDVYGVDASPKLTSAFKRRLTNAHVACESIEGSRFFDRQFDGVIAIGLMFLLRPEVQRTLIRKVAAALNAGGRFLFTSPSQVCTWTDVLTGLESRSLGADEYKTLFEASALVLVAEYEDEGENHYYDTRLTQTAAPNL